MHFIIDLVVALSSLVQFKYICAIKSMIVLEMKCPQLSKPEATAARNENSSVTEWRKKTLGETRLSRGASSLWPDKSVVCSNCSKVRV